MMQMSAKAVTGASTYSSAVQAINKVIIESKIKKIESEETYKNVQKKLNEIIDYSKLSEKTTKETSETFKKIENIKQQIRRAEVTNNQKMAEELEKDLFEAEELHNKALKKAIEENKDKTEYEKNILEILNVKQEIEECKNKKVQNVNKILVNKIRKMYIDKELCPYCHNQNPKCGFTGNKKEYAKAVKRGGHEGQDKEGKEKLEADKKKLTGNTIGVTVQDKKKNETQIDFDIGENMTHQDHHIISIAAYNDTVGLSSAAKEARFNINKNQDGMNNIKSFPSAKATNIKNSQGLNVSWNEKDHSEYHLPEPSKRKVAEEIQKETDETLHLGPHTSEVIEISKVEEQLDILGMELPKERKLSYEEMVTIELGAIQENMYNNILTGNYKCSNIEDANTEMKKNINEVIKKMSENFDSISKYGNN